MSIVLLLGGTEPGLGTITYTVEAQWQGAATNPIIFDTCDFGDGCEFVDPLDVDWASAEVAEIQNVSRIRIVRGRDDNLTSLGMGECQIVVEDNAGVYNPNNSSSPLAGYLRPMQWVRVTAEVTDVGGQSLGVQTMYEGLIRSIDYKQEPGRGFATITCGDAFFWFSRNVPVFVNQGRDTSTGEVVTSALDVVGWSATKRTVDTGDVIPSPGVSNPQGGSTALNIFQQLMEIARGDLFVTRDGKVVFYDRDRRALAADSASYNNSAVAATGTTDVERVRNKATVTRETSLGNYTSTWADGLSVADYGQQDFGEISSSIIYDQSQALGLAQWLVFQRSNPNVPFRALRVVVNTLSAATKANAAIKTEISDRLTITDAKIGTSSKAYYVEGLQHDIVASGTTKHDVTMALVPNYIDSLVLDDASRGRLGNEALAY